MTSHGGVPGARSYIDAVRDRLVDRQASEAIDRGGGGCRGPLEAGELVFLFGTGTRTCWRRRSLPRRRVCGGVPVSA